MTSIESQPLKIIRDYTTGKIKIHEHAQYNHIEAENVEVMKGIRARLFGTVRDLVLHKDSRVYVHGHVNGKITDKGGRLFVYCD
jgi:hypothetical protein